MHSNRVSQAHNSSRAPISSTSSGTIDPPASPRSGATALSQSPGSSVALENYEMVDELEAKVSAGRRLREQAAVPCLGIEQAVPPTQRMVSGPAALTPQERAAWLQMQAAKVNPNTGVGAHGALAVLTGATAILSVVPLLGFVGAAFVGVGSPGSAAFLNAAPCVAVCGGLPCSAVADSYCNRINALETPDKIYLGRHEGGGSFANVFDLMPFVIEELHPLDLPEHVTSTFQHDSDEDFIKARPHPEAIWPKLGAALITRLTAAGCVTRTPRGTFTVESRDGLGGHLAAFGAAHNLSDKAMSKIHEALVLVYTHRQQIESRHKRIELQDVLQSIDRRREHIPNAALLADSRHDDIEHAASLVQYAIGEIDSALTAAGQGDTDAYPSSPTRDADLQRLRAARRAYVEAQSRSTEKEKEIRQSVTRANRSEAHIERFLRGSDLQALRAWRDEAKGAYQAMQHHMVQTYMALPAQTST